MTSRTISGIGSDAVELIVRTLLALFDLAIRAAVLTVFIVLSLAEPFLAVFLSALSLGLFFTAVFFGFILRAPFPHRWFVLGASVVFLLIYVLYRFLMQSVEHLLGRP